MTSYYVAVLSIFHVQSITDSMSKLRDPIRDAPPLERLVHALHMLETWDLAAPFYRRFSRMQRNSGSKRERFSRLCPCVTSVHENGVWRNLEILAGRIRNVEDQNGTA